jgi:hypothetical protein
MMTPSHLKENIDDGLTRLKRQYDICVTGYDRPALKDLASILRLWVDMKQEVNYYLTVNRPASLFSAYSISKELKSLIRDREYLLVNFPRGIIVNTIPTGAGAKSLLVGSPKREEPTEIFFNIKSDKISNTVFKLSHIITLYTKKTSTQEAEKIADKAFRLEKAKFGIWLDYPAVHLGTLNKEGKFIPYVMSRENIIKRVANALGASHPRGAEETTNSFDPAIFHLMDYTALEMPLPYLILVKIAHDILEAFGRL